MAHLQTGEVFNQFTAYMYSTCIHVFWVQNMDLHNPWIALRKAWIHVLYNDPWIACSIHGLHSAKGAKLGFAQMDQPTVHCKNGYNIAS